MICLFKVKIKDRIPKKAYLFQPEVTDAHVHRVFANIHIKKPFRRHCQKRELVRQDQSLCRRIVVLNSA